MAIVSFETVAAAAEALKISGQSPSVRNVTAKLGGGSPNSVLQHLNEWKAGRPVVRAAETALDSRITSAIADQMQRIASEAAAAAEERAKSVADDLQMLSEAQHAAEQQIALLIQERDAALELAHGQTQTIETAKADAERLKQAADKNAIALRNDVDKERARQEQASAALARAEVRLEAIPGLQEEINHLRTALEREQKTRVQAEQAAAVASARLLDAEKRAESAHEQAVDAAKQAEKTVVHLTNKLEKSEKDLEKSRESVRLVGEQAAELRGRLSLTTERPQKPKPAKTEPNVKDKEQDILDLLTSSMP